MTEKRRAHAATLSSIGYKKQVKFSSSIIGNETIKTYNMPSISAT
jgi:hypothetical protein